MHSEKPCCPQCKSEKLEKDHLSQKGSAWPVLYGGTLFAKKELFAYVCTECGFVSLYVGAATKEPGDTD